MPDRQHGFIVHAYSRSRGESTETYFIGRLSDGRSFAVVENRARPALCLRRSEAEKAGAVLGSEAPVMEPAELAAMDGEECLRLSWNSSEQRDRADRELRRHGLRTYEADIRLADRIRMDAGVHGPVCILGRDRPGRRVDRVFINPQLAPSEAEPRLKLLSIDIETLPPDNRVAAAGLHLTDPFGDDRAEVLFAGGDPRVAGGLDSPEIVCFRDERALLIALGRRLREMDPDIISGWNVVDFDFQVLAGRFRAHRLAFDLGRSAEPALFLPRGERGGSRIIIPGRQVWDGLRLIRAAPFRFQEYSLGTVAEAVLGYGKRIEIRPGEERLQAILRLYRQEPAEFCRYCLQDARLVSEILERTGLFDLSLRRCTLTGVAPDRVWASIPSFEHLYTESLHRRGLLAPSRGVDAPPLTPSPGGAILTPRPGLHENVRVFDFRSLYPSIIRTFNIDPLSHVSAARAGAMRREEREMLITAPNGARFDRRRGILPELLDRFFESRRQARERGDEVASFVYKIIMNSFYGVLGAPGCRFASSALAGAITSFGQDILNWCKAYLEQKGFSVLYGDTDSLFVAGTGGPPPRDLARQVDEALKGSLAERHDVTSRLTLEAEKLYSRFFLPPLRLGNAQRGRAKGYAGLLAAEAAAGAGADLSSRLEIVGMEAVRRDWTDLAQEFQVGLLKLLFGEQDLAAFIRLAGETARRLYAGELDGKLVYRKALRKPVSAYTRTTPPHVKAAALLPPARQRGLIRYVVTRDGPQPENSRSAPPDYDHYLEKQLKPIASMFLDVLHTDLQQLFGSGGQLLLF
jgi:DNA polymerase-2